MGWDGKVIAESGAIVELLIQKLAPHLAPDMDESTYVDYLQWIHFSESSAMLPFLLKTFNTRLCCTNLSVKGFSAI